MSISQAVLRAAQKASRAKILCLLTATCLAASINAGQTEVTLRESFQEFVNPGQGWMTWLNTGVRPSCRPNFPCSVGYFRLDWKDLEPADGNFDWSQIDERLKLANESGLRIAFRIMTANAHSRGYYSSPKWLFDLGCKSFVNLADGADATSGGARIPRIEPDYSDPLFLERHGAFLRALAARYDGNPLIEFVDIGSYGIWGEWHTTHPVGIDSRRRIVDFYLRAFNRTRLVMMTDDAEALSYALQQHRTGMRRDGVGSPWHQQNWIGSNPYSHVAEMAEVWKSSPIVFEWFGTYRYLVDQGWSFQRAVQFMLNNHVSLISDNVGDIPPEALPQLHELTRRTGYRFVLRHMSHASELPRGSDLIIKMNWSNVGVAKPYDSYRLEISLMGAQGETIARSLLPADLSTWMPGDIVCQGAIAIGGRVKPGKYDVAVAIVDTAGRPSVRLAIDIPEVDRRYRVSSISVTPN